MQRLALVAGVGESSLERVRAAYRPSIGAYFGMGLVGGGVAGAVALLTLQLASGQINPPSVRVPSAIAALGHWVSEPAVPRFGKAPPVVVREPQPDAFDIVIDRSVRASAPFGLRLVGTEDTGMEVLLRDVPAAALLSHGERRGESTWAVKATDLEGLHLTLNDGTPDAFNVRIEVLAPAGVAAASSVARVRLVGSSGAERPASAPLDAAMLVEPEAFTTTVAHMDPPFQTRTTIAARNDAAKGREKVARASAPPAATTVVEIDRRASHSAPQAAPQAETRHWPEGASGLGAMSRESDRQVWWKLPALTWSPFLDVAGR
jgi:hypothetical protein